MSKTFITLTLFFLALPLSAAHAQKRDFMTDAEIEVVRDSQQIDLRIETLTKMIDRRFALLKLDVGGWRPSAKDSERWGLEPAGSRFELLTDIKRLLQKAVDDIDDLAARDKSALEENRVSGKFFPKAVRMLGSAAARYLPVLNAAAAKATDEIERGAILASIELCNQVAEAAAQLPAEINQTKKRPNR